MIPSIAVPASLSILMALLAIVVFLHNPKERSNMLFLVYVLSVIGWIISNYFADSFFSVGWTKSTYFFSFLVTYFFLLFVEFFPVRKLLPRQIRLVVNGILLTVTALLVLPGGLLVVGITKYETGVNVETGPAFFLAVIFYLSTLLLSFYWLFRRLRGSQGIERLQIQYVFIGFGIAFAFVAATNLFIPLATGNYFYSQYGPYGLIFFIILTALAIVRWQLFNVTIIATEVFVVLLIILQAAQMFVARDSTALFTNIVVVILTIVLSYFLLRSSIIEYKQRLQLAQLTKRLEDANMQLKHLDETKSEFVSIASHQLRTPLTVIKGYLSMLQEGTYGKIPADQQAPMEKVYVSANRLIELVENLLSVSRIESGRMKYNYEQTSVTDMATSVIDEISQKAKEKDLKLQFNRPKDDLPELMIDADKVRQVMMNLVDNAVKYTKRGSVIVSVRLAGPDSEPHVTEPSVVFEVKDTGLGVRREDIDRLFQKFIRGQGSSLVHTEGTGLGLYVGRMMVEAHGGNIWVTSRGEGLGSVFAFSLPLKGSPRAAAPSAS